MQAPSTTLLRTFLRPSLPSPCITCQKRMTSNFMPRSKYAKISRLDKLHRQQKAAVRQEKKDSVVRAQALETLLGGAAIRPTPVDVGGTTEEQQGPSPVVSLKRDFPFTIERTPTSNLPVYEDSKAGGSKHITIVRKLSGDLEALQKELRGILQLPEFIIDSKGRKKDTVAINRTTRQIIVRGWRGPEIKKWAEMSGF